MMTRSDWLELVQRNAGVEEKRYCYQRMIKANPNDTEAHDLLRAIGPGDTRVPNGYNVNSDEIEYDMHPAKGIALYGVIILIAIVAVFIILNAA